MKNPAQAAVSSKLKNKVSEMTGANHNKSDAKNCNSKVPPPPPRTSAHSEERRGLNAFCLVRCSPITLFLNTGACKYYFFSVHRGHHSGSTRVLY